MSRRRPSSLTPSARLSRPQVLSLSVLTGTLVLTGCSGPGSEIDSSATTPTDVSTDVAGSEVTLRMFDGAGLTALDEAQIAAFEEQNPNITIELTTEPDEVMSTTLPRVLASEDPACIHRVGTLESHVEDSLLTSLEPYAEAYGWSEIPASQLVQYRVNEDGVRGDGDLYAMPSGFVLESWYVNKSMAADVGMSEPPTTLEELETVLTAAKEADQTPIMVNNADGGLGHVYQFLLNYYMGAEATNEWIFRTPGATIDSPEGIQAAQTLTDWIEAGYFNEDANAVDGQQALGRFMAGESVFLPSGNWNAGPIQQNMADNAGFFLAPPVEAGARHVAQSNAASPFGIPADCENKNEAAAYLNFLRSDEARQAALDNGYLPLGEASESSAQPTTEGVFADVQGAFTQLAEDDGVVDFVQNATPGLQSNAWTPEGQRLFAGEIMAEEFVSNIQAVYEEEIGR